MGATWRSIDTARAALGDVSRASLARRAGVNESTITKGISRDASPTPDVLVKVELVLAEEYRRRGGATPLAQRTAAAGWRHEVLLDDAGVVRDVVVNAEGKTIAVLPLPEDVMAGIASSDERAANARLTAQAPALLGLIAELVARADRDELNNDALLPARALLATLAPTELRPPG